MFVNHMKTSSVLNHTAAGAGSTSAPFVLDADSVLLSLWCRSVTGTLSVALWTQTRDGEDRKVAEFAAVTGPTTELLFQRTADVLANCRIEASWTGAVEFEVQAKGYAGAQDDASATATLASGQPSTATLALTLANTEYAYTFPDGTRRFTVRCRVPATLKVGGASGFTTDYLSILPGVTWSEASLDLTNRTIYVTSTIPANTLEILSWA